MNHEDYNLDEAAYGIFIQLANNGVNVNEVHLADLDGNVLGFQAKMHIVNFQ